jgi:hypothetical protein
MLRLDGVDEPLVDCLQRGLIVVDKIMMSPLATSCGGHLIALLRAPPLRCRISPW